MRLAIVGAGLAGLAAAHWLRRERPDLELTVWEKSRGVGGRAATRRQHGAIYDHGAQYVKAHTPALERLLTETLAHDTLADIALPVWTFDGAGVIAEGDPAQNADPKWTYRDGLTRLAKELARDVEVRTGVRVASLGHVPRVAGTPALEDRLGATYHLHDDSGTPLGATDAVLLTPPAPQMAELLALSTLPAAAREILMEELNRAVYRRCLTIVLGYAATPRERPWYALVNTDRQHPLSWLAYEHVKPGRATGGGVLIAQMAPGWSDENWDDALPEATTRVAALVGELLGEELSAPSWSDRQGW